MKVDTTNISYHEEVLKSENFKNLFCNEWTVIKTGLTALQSSFKNGIVRFLFQIVIDAGQATYDKTCGGA